MLNDFYKDTVQVSRSTTANRKKTFAVVVADMPAHIQPFQDTMVEGGVSRTFNEFLMFTDSQVVIGDKIEDQNNKLFEVIGVSEMNFRIGRRHYESTLKAL